MAKDITKKKKKKEESDLNSFDNEYDVLQRVVNVETKEIKNDLNEDYVLMHGDLPKEDYISENLVNAHYAKKIIQKYSEKRLPRWDNKGMDYFRNEDGSIKLFPMSEQEIEKITNNGKKIFDFFMLSSHAIAVLNRNKGNNFLVKLLGKHKEEEQQIMYGPDDRGMLQKIKDKLNGNQEVVEEI